uniref:Uncharacterized protein n=1 Tax=Otus sunia TaxID=257818 RepID=A0A8C8AFH7_9STRI
GPRGLQPPPTVVTHDWHHANMDQLKSSEDSRECAGRLNADSMRLVQDKDQLTYQMQKDKWLYSLLNTSMTFNVIIKTDLGEMLPSVRWKPGHHGRYI